MHLCYDESTNVGVNALVQNKHPNPMTQILFLFNSAELKCAV